MSQRGRLMGILAAALLPLAALAVGLLWRDAQAVEDRVAGDRVKLAQSGALTVSQFLEGSLRTLQAVATDVNGLAPADVESQQLPFRLVLAANDTWSGLGLHDSGGERLIGASGTGVTSNIADRAYFQHVIGTGEPTISSAVLGRGSGQPLVVLAAPTTLADGERGVVVAAMQLASLSESLLATLGQPDVRISLLDSDGQVIAHPDPARVAALESQAERPEVAAARLGTAGNLIGERDGRQTLVAYAPVPVGGWTLLIAEPTALAFAPAREMLYQGIALLALALLAVVVIGWMLGSVVSRSYASEQQAREEADRQRRTAEDSQRRYADLVDGLDGVVWEARTDDLTFTFVSPAAQTVLGRPPEHWTDGRARWGDHIHPEDAAYVLEHCVRELREGLDHSCEYRVVHPDGRETWVADMIRSTRGEDGRTPVLRGMMIDVTDRHQAEHERARLLEGEQHARREAEAAVRSRDEFLSIASHELRNPVAAIKGTGQLIQRLEARGSLAPEVHNEYLETIVRTTDRLTRLVEDLLDVSRLRGDQFELRMETLDISRLVQDAARMEALDGRVVHIRGADLPLAARVDPDRIQQILQNLLENAAKYSPPDAPIEVGVYRDGGTLEIAVTDHGIGLPSEAADALFTPFGRAPNAVAANIPGMGLGLYICRRLAEAHGGSLQAESRGEGRGSTFRLALPHAEPQSEPQTGTQTEAQTGTQTARRAEAHVEAQVEAQAEAAPRQTDDRQTEGQQTEIGAVGGVGV